MILVTGGCGFIGSHVVKALVEDSNEVVAFDIVMPSPLPQPLRDVADKVKFVTGDVTNLEELQKVFVTHDIDHVVHLSWLMGKREQDPTWPFRSLKVNVEGTCNVLEASRLTHVKRVVFPSSEDVYGSAALYALPVKEDTPLSPAAREGSILYASTKAMAEYLFRYYHSRYQLDYIMFRFGTIYGFGSVGWLANFFLKPLQGEPYQTQMGWGWDENRYNLLCVKDVAKAIKLALKIKDPKFRIFNVSGGIFSIRNLVEITKKLVPGAVIYTKAGTDLTLTPALMDISLAKKELRYEPSYPLEKGARDFVDQIKLYTNVK